MITSQAIALLFLFAAGVLALLSIFIAPRRNLLIGAAILAIIGLVIQVFLVGRVA